MKRILSVFMALLMLLVCVGAACADTDATGQGTDRHASSIDAVIVLDQSTSMRNKANNSDPLDYRLDAAQMFIGMCDITNSRVAFLTFSGTVQKSDFVAMNNTDARTAELKEIEALREGALGENTDMGDALIQAVKMLIDRPADATNQPMILLLTDGQNDFGGGTISKRVYWNPKTKTFTDKNGIVIRNYDKDDADQQFAAAGDVAQQYGIPVYTIALYSEKKGPDSPDVREYASALQQMSEETNGLSTAVSSADALQLPKFFGSMFATQIGSTLLRDQDLQIYELPNKPGRFAVDLPILNQSVMEANIFIPLANLNQDRIWLFDANNEDRTFGAKDVLTSSSKYFRLYKITKPGSLGNWRLEFELMDPSAKPNDISFSLLYNYDISLKSQIGKNASTLNEIGEGLSLAKNETIHVDSRFYNSDDTPSDDRNLYAIQNGPDWETIRGTCTLEDLHGNAVFAVAMTSQGDRFTADIDLTKAALTPEGKNALKGGDYTLRIVADGAGLHRENELPITLTNNPPEVGRNPLNKVVYVDDPADPATQKPQTVAVILSEYVRDIDNDQLTFSEPKPVDSAREIIDMKLVHNGDGTWSAVGTTIKDEATGLFKSGVAKYTLTVTDQEETRDIALEVTIHSKTSESLSAYTCETTVDGLGPNNIAPKNSDVTFRMHLNSKDANQADTSGAVKDFHGTAYIFNADNTDTYLQKADMTLNSDGTQLIGVYRTGNTKANLKAVCVYTYGHTEQYAGEFEQLFQIENHPPQPVQAGVDMLPESITFDPLPAWLAGLESPTPEAEMTFTFTNLFADVDNEAGLVFLIPSVVAREDVDPATLLQMENDGQTVRLMPVGEGQVTLTFTATDGDNETATITRTLNISSVVAKWTRIGIVAGALFLLLALIILLLLLKSRPRYPKGCALYTRESAAIFPSIYELPPSQKTIPLSHCVDMDLASRNGISNELLSNILIKPVRRPSGSISVKMAKAFPGYQVELENLPLEKKFTLWASNQEIKLTGRGNTNYLRVQFVLGGNDNVNGPLNFQELGGGFGMMDAKNDFGDIGGFDDFGGTEGQGGFGSNGGNDVFGGFGTGGFDSNANSDGDSF